MTCDKCNREMNYSYYINDAHWMESTGGVREGHICAHCMLESLGGLDWYIIENEPQIKSMDHQGVREEMRREHLDRIV